VGNVVIFKINEHVVGRYSIDLKNNKPHFHPLFSSGGKRVTRAYPMEKGVPGESKDHEHHVGLWIGHQIVELEAREERPPLNVNFWATLADPRRQQLGKQVCTGVEEPQNHNGQASIVTYNTWQTTSGIKILEETRTLSLVDLSLAQLIVFDLDLHATEGAVTFGDEKDGFFAIRVNDVMTEKRKEGGLLENAEGKQHMGTNDNKDRQACWGLKSAWVDYSGIVDGEKVGVTLFDHPKNPVPACWHARDYGLLSANPFGRTNSKFPDAKDSKKLVKIPAGEHLRLRYAVLIHPGDAREGRVSECYRKFVELK